MGPVPSRGVLLRNVAVTNHKKTERFKTFSLSSLKKPVSSHSHRFFSHEPYLSKQNSCMSDWEEIIEERILHDRVWKLMVD